MADSDLQRHLDLLEARKVLVRDLAEKHNIPGFDRNLLSEADMNEFEEKLEESISAQQAKIEKIKVSQLFHRSLEGAIELIDEWTDDDAE